MYSNENLLATPELRCYTKDRRIVLLRFPQVVDKTIRTCARALTPGGAPSKLCLGGSFLSPRRAGCPKIAVELSMAVAPALLPCDAFSIQTHPHPKQPCTTLISRRGVPLNPENGKVYGVEPSR